MVELTQEEKHILKYHLEEPSPSIHKHVDDECEKLKLKGRNRKEKWEAYSSRSVVNIC